MNFCATKFISLVAFEQLNTPTPQPGFRSIAACRPDAALSRASSHVAVRRPPFERTIGSVSRTSPFLIERTPSERPLFGSILGRCYQADESQATGAEKGPAVKGAGMWKRTGLLTVILVIGLTSVTAAAENVV